MKIGKVSELMMNRSVFKLFRHRRNEVEKKPVAGVDATKVTVGKEKLYISTNPVMLSLDELGKKAIYYVANNIACVGGELIGIVVDILLPACSDEKDIKVIMNDLEEECNKLDIEVMGGHTCMTDSVVKPLVTVTGLGKAYVGCKQVLDNDDIVNSDRKTEINSNTSENSGENKKSNRCCDKTIEYNIGNMKDIKPGFDIVMVNWAGMSGASIIAEKGKEELKKRLSNEIIEDAISLKDEISVLKEAYMAIDNGAYYLHDVTKGGVFAGLWEVSSVIKKGIEVDIKKIPLRQDIIEVCEHFDVNPFNLEARGALLVVTKNGEALVDKYMDEGIEAAVIGRVAEHKNKLVVNEDETRYLDSPSSDEVYKFV